MIKSIFSGSEFIGVQTSSSSAPYISPGALSAGQLRYNSNTQNMEVYDGNAWLTLSYSASVELTHEAEEILRWARVKKQEEQQILELAEKHPGIKDLKEKLDIMIALANNDSR